MPFVSTRRNRSAPAGVLSLMQPPETLPELPGLEIVRQLGRGGSATVYLAQQASVSAGYVAVKVIDGADPNVAGVSDELSREAEVIRQLRHPSIVRVYDFGTHGQWHYLVSEYLSGGDLKQRIQKGISVDESLDFAKKLALALGAAHEKGVVHRDVKPENVLFRRNGTPVLTDFGIAAALSESGREDAMASTTPDASNAGTPSYMSPEQIEGRALGNGTDIYSLGAMLFEMLTGAPPYVFDSPEAIMYAHVHRSIPNLPSHLAELQPLIGRLLAKEPAGRPATGAEAAELIDEHWLLAPPTTDKPVAKRPVQQGTKATPRPEQNRTAPRRTQNLSQQRRKALEQARAAAQKRKASDQKRAAAAAGKPGKAAKSAARPIAPKSVPGSASGPERGRSGVAAKSAPIQLPEQDHATDAADAVTTMLEAKAPKPKPRPKPAASVDELDQLAEAALSSQEEEMERTAEMLDDEPAGWSGGPKENVMRELARARACLEVGDYEGGRRLLAELANVSDEEVSQAARELLQALSLH